MFVWETLDWPNMVIYHKFYYLSVWGKLKLIPGLWMIFSWQSNEVLNFLRNGRFYQKKEIQEIRKYIMCFRMNLYLIKSDDLYVSQNNSLTLCLLFIQVESLHNVIKHTVIHFVNILCHLIDNVSICLLTYNQTHQM